MKPIGSKEMRAELETWKSLFNEATFPTRSFAPQALCLQKDNTGSNSCV